ncbi:baseplate protein [Vibrio phage PWH3a-P1]|uniref:baseplate protein n=1 Tax=Vibrio phage PWH3a-P1 TaxID=754058 RepID=UPI0002C0D1E0|nr:baseplate protein [Vibrio phage PWH3a-P1]AGH32063.1 hypothetical protein VPIG_00207 [Vibrio phage PWH3a-P1]
MALPDSNRLKFNITFTQDGLSELPWVQTQRENFYKLARLIVNRLDNIQNQTVALAYSRILDLAEGDMLDIIASHYFIEREGKDDEDLKSAIKLYALRQNTEPTRTEIVNILNILTDDGFVKIYKGVNNYIEVVISVDCLSIQSLSDQLQDLFPINTNLKVASVPVGIKPFGVGSVYSTASDKIGTLGSVHDPVIDRQNVAAVTVINDERDL